MKLPNGGRVIVDERKIREYLVSPSHPVGRFKAKFFAGLGFGPENWQELAAALADVAAKGEAPLVEDSGHGRKYLVSWGLTGPQGRSADVVSVWIVRVGDDTPRLVTVYPR
jgi:hypothetical protein